jgi:DNA-3-methyladenine glycosylase II
MDLPPHIRTHENLLEAARLVADRDADLGRALGIVEQELGPLPDRMRLPDFASLLFLIAGQLVSNAAAHAIWKRIETHVVPLTPEGYLALGDEKLKLLGLSGPKRKYAQGLAESLASGALDLEALTQMDPEAAEQKLLEIKGIGPWTAQAYLLFSHGALDAWPSGDIALQSAAGDLLRWEVRPKTAQLEEIGERWRPWRGVAAHILWAYYKCL